MPMKTADPAQSQSLLEAILESAAGAIIAIDHHGLIQSVNPATTKLFGYAQADLIGKNVAILMPEPDRARHDAYIDRHMTTGERRIIGIGRETTGLRKSGETFPMHLSVSAFEVGGVRYYAGIIHDLSQRTKLEAEIDRQALLFQAVFDHVPEAILITDPDFNVLLLNPAAEGLLSGLEEEFPGGHLATLFADPGDFDALTRGLGNAGQKRKPVPLSANLRGIGGAPLPGEVLAAEISSASGRRTGVVVVVRDLTEERQREEALLKSQRLEAIGQLTGGIAHDFNNLLTIVSGNLELMDLYITDARAHDHLKRAAQAVDAGARLTSRLLTFARRRRLEPQVVDLNDQVRLMSELLRRTLGETIQLSTILLAKLWPTRVDPSEVENAVVNLAINARDALPQGGKLVIETTNILIDAETAAGTAGLGAGEFVRLSVSDNGTGMPKEVLARAFEPFFTTKPTGRGTGLGLSTIYGFVKQSNGHVTIYSEPGLGTTVNIYLPRYEGAEIERTETPKAIADDAMPAGGHILLVEDNHEVRAVALALLKRLGYEVTEANTAVEAIAHLESGLTVEAVFSDVIMPGGLSGFDLARWLVANKPELPILLTTGFSEEIARQRETDAANPQILRKPYTQAELGAMLRAIIGAKNAKASS